MTLEACVKRRTAIKVKISNIRKQLDKHDTTPLSAKDLMKIFEDLDKHMQAINEIQDEIYPECVDDNHISDQVGLAEEIEKSVTELKEKAATLFEPFKKASTIDPTIKSDCNVKLPRIELPNFDGRFESWTSFKDLFVATIGNNKSLGGAQKLQYLKSSLKGEASGLIRTLQVTDGNYQTAWDLLLGRYDNEREIISSVLHRLNSQPHITKESSSSLQKLVDTTNECLQTLRVLGRPVDTWDDMLVFLIVERLDSESRKQWAMTLKGTNMPTFKELSEFLDQHIRGLLAGSGNKPQQKSVSYGGNRNTTSHHITSNSVCPICQGEHQIFNCKKFTAGTPSERHTLARRHKLCFNCLRSNHGLKDCKSQNTCRKCNGQHNTLLHMDRKQTIVQQQESQDSSSSTSKSLFSHDAEGQVLLGTAIVKVTDNLGVKQFCRVLLDDGSQATLISERCAASLGLKRSKTNVTIEGVGSASAGVARGQVQVNLESCITNSSIEIQALVLPKVTGNLPNFKFSAKNWNHIEGLSLADPAFYKPGPIDILLGAEYTGLIREYGKHIGPKNTAIAQKTIFGWAMSGLVLSSPRKQVIVHHVSCESIIKRFWELEETPTIKHLSPEEKKCEDHFIQTHKRDSTGRYEVQLPFNNKVHKLGLSRQNAVNRLKSVERKLASQPDKKEQYSKFMKDFLDLKHMELVPESEVNKGQGKYYYLPHHCVLKDSSSTTKLRVVFDGSCKSSSGISLNDCLMVGPTVQEELLSILLRFRTHIIALKADIAKFYRQFKVADFHQDYQRIIWRDSTSEPFRDYRLVRVTYGTATGAYLSTRSLIQLSKDEEFNYPAASKVMSQDFYVDDLLSGEATAESAIALQKQLASLVSAGGMEIRKWASNSPAVLKGIHPEDREIAEPLSFDRDDYIKALGVQWHPATDKFMFSVSASNLTKVTKRVILSELAKVFDPLGFLSPTTIIIKLLFQDLWKLKVNWDEDLPNDTKQQWHNYQQQLQNVREIKIPRCIVSTTVLSKQLHGFSDASEKAYAGAVYLRVEKSDGIFMVNLIASKTKVAPLQQQSIPRLELCAALLLAKLLTYVRDSMKLDCELFAWTDSTVVLHWLASYPGRWKTFVANRVSEIQELVTSDHWYHVSTTDNPADCASRGISAAELKSSNLWWNGPHWLQQSTFDLKQTTVIDSSLSDLEVKAKQVISNHICIEPSVVSRFRSLTKLKRVTAYCLRFLHNTRSKDSKIFGELTSDELQQAFFHWIRHSQAVEFAAEVKSLKSNGEVSHNSKLLSLYPYLDALGIIRVGGRLQNAKVPEDQKHQIILSPHHQLSKLIIQHYHIINLHAGNQLLLATVRQQFWIINAKDLIRNIIRKCVICRRHRAQNAQQLMGSLPTARVTPGRPFIKCGVDYAGPLSLRVVKGRGQKTFKGYICLFVCLATKAIHLEAVSELTSSAFIAAFRRFISRRGLSTDMYSDCGTNFVGADKEMKKMLESSNHNSAIHQELSCKGISWHFNPPGAPHHGGLWEAGVKSVKNHLHRVVGTNLMNFEELQTFLCQIEACLNSRPLCAMSSDPADLTVLTPGHFLISEPLNALPEPDLTTTNLNRLSRWQLIQQLMQHFWRRWTSEYLSTLQQRFRWATKRENLQLNDLVLIKDESLPPCKWKLGRIIEIHPGKDQQVRVVTIKTADGEFKRPVNKLCPILQSE